MNRIRSSRGVDLGDADDAEEGLYERIGLAIAEFLAARREDPFVSLESYLWLFPGDEDVARDCFEAAELLLQVCEANRLSK
jgi:hypothetical protein